MIPLLQGFALILFCGSLVLIIRLIRVTGRAPVWIFFMLAFILCAVYRTLAVSNVFISSFAGTGQRSGLLENLLAAGIALCLFCGSILLAPLFTTVKRSGEALRKILESGADGIVYTDAQGVIQYASPALATLLGRDSAELDGMNVLELVAAEGYGRARKAIDKLRGSMRQVVFECELTTLQGATIPCEVNGVSQVRGTAVQSMHFAVRDISARKSLENLQHRHNAELRMLLDAVPSMIIYTDLEGNILRCNQAFAASGKTTPEAITGRRLTEIFPVEEAQQRMRDDGEVTASGEPRGNIIESFNTPAGLRWTRTTKLPLRDAQGTVTGLLTVAEDITDLKSAEAQLRRLNDDLEKRVQKRTLQLEQSNAELQQFAYVASHDLQEPLRKIITFGERLEQLTQGQLDERAQDSLKRMCDAAARMRMLVEDLLQLSRVTTHGDDFAAVNLTAVIAGVLDDLEQRINETGARVEIGILPQVFADERQIRQLFQNLLANALKFIKEGTPPLIRINGRQQSLLTVEIAVEDNGIGFDMKFLERIFQPFERLHSNRAYSGSGIGLALCKKIVERHDGSITARSNPDEGATFLVTLPSGK